MATPAAVAAASAASTQCCPSSNRLDGDRSALQCAAGAHESAAATAHSISTTASTSGFAWKYASSRSLADADSSAWTVAPAALSQPSETAEPRTGLRSDDSSAASAPLLAAAPSGA